MGAKPFVFCFVSPAIGRAELVLVSGRARPSSGMRGPTQLEDGLACLTGLRIANDRLSPPVIGFRRKPSVPLCVATLFFVLPLVREFKTHLCCT